MNLVSSCGVKFWVFVYSVCGNAEESISVMNNAVQTAVMCNALGVLICDWSVPGHVNPLTVSIPALLAGAGFAWKASVDVVSSLCISFVEYFRLATKLMFCDDFSNGNVAWSVHFVASPARDNVLFNLCSSNLSDPTERTESLTCVTAP